MLKYSVAAIFSMPVAAQDVGSQGYQAKASAGDGFLAQDWDMDSPDEVDEWPDGSFADQPPEYAHALAGPNETNPSVVLAGGLDDDPFVLDGRFNDGQMYTDRFSTINDGGYTTDKYAYKALRLSNGDVLMVGLVPKIGTTLNPLNTAGLNIGMARYSPTGVRKKWTKAAAAFTDVSRDFYVFPNKDVYDSQGSFQSISDVKENDGWVYILADRFRSATNMNTNVRLIRFQLSSSKYKGGHVFVNEGMKEAGVGMHFYSDGGFDKLTVAVRRNISTSTLQTWMKSYLVGSASTLAVDSGFGTNGIRNVSPTDCGACKPIVLAASATEAGATYLAGNYAQSSANQDGYITKLDKNGTAVNSFGNNGRTNFYFNDTPTAATEAVKDMIVETISTSFGMRDRIYVLSVVDATCGTTSAGIFKFDSGAVEDHWFGTGGQLLFGGGGTGTSIFDHCNGTRSMVPSAMALNGNRLAVVGYSTTHPDPVTLPWGSPPDRGGPSFSMVDKDIGYVSDSRRIE